KLCTDNCLERLHSGSYCRQCSYPMSLDISTHKCLSCCTSNVTTDDCCQCSSIWDAIETIAKLLVNAFVKKNNDTELSLNGIHREEIVTQTTTLLAQA
ncbi:unnamed protein product, partial [Rotaria sp. Silwood1]